MDYKFKSQKVEHFVDEMKANYFDVDNIRQRHMNIIEGLIGNESSETRELELQQLWSDYHEAERQCRLAANRMIKAMEQIDNCFQSYHRKIYQVEGIKNLSSNQVNNQSISESTENDKTEVVDVSDKVVTPAEVVTPVPVAETQPVEAVPPVVEETAMAVAPVVAETQPVEVVPPAVEETVGEIAPVATETQPVEATPAVAEATIPVPTPIVEETKVVEETPREGIIPVTVEEKTNEVGPTEVNTQDNEWIFVKNNTNEPKAIIINVNQKNKLSSSLATQKSLVNHILLPQNKEEVSSEQQVENLMNQLPTLYAQGKVEEAEKISEQIRSLSKSVAPTV